MKKILFLIITLISILTFGCGFSDSQSDKETSVKDNITIEDIENVKKVTDEIVYNEIKNKYNMDDKDMVLYYRKVIDLNNKYITESVLENYDKPYLQAMYYCNDNVVKSTDKANKNLKIQFINNESTKSALDECTYKIKVTNNNSAFDIAPRIFFIARDKLTKLPIFADSISFDELKRDGKESEEEIELPVSECEIISSSVYAVPEKLVVHGFGVFWSTIVEKYPDKKFADEYKVNVPAVVTGTIFNENVQKRISPDEGNGNVKWVDGGNNYDKFKKGTRVVVRYSTNGYCLVSDALGGYAFVKESDLKIDNPKDLIRSKMPLFLITRVPNKSFFGVKVYFEN